LAQGEIGGGAEESQGVRMIESIQIADTATFAKENPEKLYEWSTFNFIYGAKRNG